MTDVTEVTAPDAATAAAVVTDAPASRPLRKDAARNRAALVEAARVVFAERGLDATLDDVARQAGVGVGTAYRHFANKYELAQAVFTQAVDEIVAAAESAADAEDPWQGIVRVVEGIATAQTADRGLREVLMGQHDSARMEQVTDRLMSPLARLVERAKQAGKLRADAELSDLGMAVMMLCGIADVAVDVAPDVWRRYLPIVLDGLRPGEPLPGTALSVEQMREAMSSHKQRISRAGGCAVPPRAASVQELAAQCGGVLVGPPVPPQPRR